MIACSHFSHPGRQAREGRGWGNGPMYWFFFCNLSNAILMMCLSCNMQRKRICHNVWTRDLSNTRDFIGEVAKYVATPLAWSELALPSDNSKHDCTGLKIDSLRKRLAYITVFGLILKWKSHTRPWQKDILTFIAGIFANLCKKVENGPNWEFFFLKFDFSFLKN